MPLIWTTIGSLGHAVAALLFASLAILTSRKAGGQLKQQLLVIALALTALWSLRHALGGALIGETLSDGVGETMRNAAWLAVVWVHLRAAPAGRASRIGRPLVIGALVLLLAVEIAFDLLVGGGARVSAALVQLERVSWLLRCVFALGGLVLLHGLSSRREKPTEAGGDLWVAAALAFMWAYDFNHYMLAWATENAVVATGPMRGFVVALLAIPLVVGLRTGGERRLALSRPVALRLVSAGIIAIYLVSVALLVTMTRDVTAPFGRLVQLSLLFALAVAVLALVPSAALRSWLRVEITKHFFAHRYDYRAVWLGFAQTVGRTGEGQGPLGERLTRAISEVVQARGALLFLRGPEGALIRAHDWQWPADADPIETLPAALADRLEPTGWILDIATDWASHGELLPAWMEGDARAWVLAPLIHEGRLAGAILLAAPTVTRRIDWEDLDVLRVVCGEAAALISEARSREALAEAQRFEEFNRRFAFILHDLKNLVSQMSLLASNAERHAHNPDFRADMVLTLKDTVARMTDLLGRLDRPGRTRASGLIELRVGALLRALQPRWASGLGPVELSGDIPGAVHADQENLERALGHLVKNGLEASSPGAPVQVELATEQGKAVIRVRDQGCGMSAEFIRDELFRPFSSTKSTGFGLGVHEVRLLVSAMGGALDVDSTPGSGTTFTVRLPLIKAGPTSTPDGSSPPDDHMPMRRTA
ncbi:MAG: PEP-CTERM system histidine kinase PrsK [Sphingobium sp.]|nr:PEP-CTERM system histidine kinase PrsK [Sphingobium sp.]